MSPERATGTGVAHTPAVELGTPRTPADGPGVGAGRGHTHATHAARVSSQQHSRFLISFPISGAASSWRGSVLASSNDIYQSLYKHHTIAPIRPKQSILTRRNLSGASFSLSGASNPAETDEEERRGGETEHFPAARTGTLMRGKVGR